jgi:hypothetical protein
VPNVPANQESVAPQSFANVPPDLSANAGQARLVVKALEDSIGEIKTDIKEIKSHRHSDFVWLVTVFAAGFLLLAGLFGFGYFRVDDKFERLTDKLDKLTASSIRADTKLEDLLQRIPPAVTPAPKR